MKDYLLNKALKEDTKDLETIVNCASYIPDFNLILKDAIREVLKEDSVDNKKLQLLMSAAAKLPNFDYAEVFKQNKV